MDTQIKLNRTHCQFRLRDEVLCMIPCEPLAIPITSIAKDLGVSRASVHIMVSALRDKESYPVKLIKQPRSCGGPLVTCKRRWWPVVRHNAMLYWNAVYGDNKPWILKKQKREYLLSDEDSPLTTPTTRRTTKRRTA